MNSTTKLGMFLVAIWLIVTGLLPLLNVSTPLSDTILAVLAIAAGILILPGPRKLAKNLGMLSLGVWLIVTSLLTLLNVHIPVPGNIVLALLAIAAGILIIREQ
jgi:hypothetical protein